MEEYEKLHEGRTLALNESILHNSREFVLTKVGGITADKAGFREYVYAN
jgi:hydroxymethylglutaryl-CoA synthase